MSGRRKLSHRSKRAQRKTLHRFIPFIIVIIIIFSAIIIYSNQPAPTDPKTFCPRDSLGQGMTALVIDVSDNLTNSQKARLENELQNISNVSPGRLKAFLKKGEKLVVYFVESEGQEPSKLFSMCHPGDVKNRTFSDELSEGLIFAQRKWKKFTQETVMIIDAKIDSASLMETSPIIETLQFIRAKEFPPPDLINNAFNYRIVLWSDLLQNSIEATHFSSLGDFKDVVRRNPLELSGIQVSIFQFISKKYSQYQTKEHVTWWRKILATAQADLVMWEKI